VDCESLACIADKDKIPADVFKECCEPCGTFPGCCDCDYGETPPPQCCK
jgi:hypothetical protein